MSPESKYYDPTQDIARLQARIFDLERKVRDLEQAVSRFRELEQAIEEFGIKLKSAQEASGAF